MRAIARLCVSADAYKGKAVSSVREIFDVGLSPGMRAFFFFCGGYPMLCPAICSLMRTVAAGGCVPLTEKACGREGDRELLRTGRCCCCGRREVRRRGL